MNIEKDTTRTPGYDRGFLNSELVSMFREYWSIICSNDLIRRILRSVFRSFVILLSVIFFFSIFIYIIPFIQEAGQGESRSYENNTELKSDPEYRRQILNLGNDVRYLSGNFNLLTPGSSYLVINTTDNRFFLYSNKKLIREGFCSSGSYTRLTTPEGNRQWTFKTPKGKFWIQGKIIKPLWIRPDWSFIEEGLPVPAADDESRYEYGVLGDYALSLGDGYLIHGTLYKRFLGMPVTHGCVRLNDDDLEAIYHTLNIGSKVFIF